MNYEHLMLKNSVLKITSIDHETVASTVDTRSERYPSLSSYTPPEASIQYINWPLLSVVRMLLD